MKHLETIELLDLEKLEYREIINKRDFEALNKLLVGSSVLFTEPIVDKVGEDAKQEGIILYFQDKEGSQRALMLYPSEESSNTKLYIDLY